MTQMKTVLLALMLVSTLAMGQKAGYQYQNQVEYTQINNTQTYYEWQLSNAGCYGCASFYWKVGRTPIAGGNWQFDLWFYSNSFYANGTWGSTYVNGIMVNVDGYYLRKDPVWILFKDKYANQ